MWCNEQCSTSKVQKKLTYLFTEGQRLGVKKILTTALLDALNILMSEQHPQFRMNCIWLPMSCSRKKK